MAKQLEGPRQIMIKDVTIQFPKLSRAVTYQGKDQWECGLITEDPKQAKEWVDQLLPKVKPNDAMAPSAWTCSLSRKVLNKDGTAKDPIRVVDANKRPLTPEQLRKVGNGSVANLIIFQGPYDNEFGKGTTNSLTAIQITHLEEYEGSMDDVDFDIEGDQADVEGASAEDIF